MPVPPPQARHRARSRVLAVLLALAALAAVLVAALAGPDVLATPHPWFALTGLLSGAGLLAGSEHPRDVRAGYGTVGAAWGGGHLVATALLAAHPGAGSADLVATTAGMLAVFAVMQLTVRRTVARPAVLPLVLDASLLGATLALLSWHVLTTTGATGTTTLERLCAPLLVLCATHVAARGANAAVDDHRLRRPGTALALCGLAEIPALHAELTGSAGAGWLAIGLVAVGAAGSAIKGPTHLAPRTAAAVLAEHRRTTAALVALPLLLADLAWLVADPASADRFLLGLHALVLLLYAARHLETTRAYSAVADDLRAQALTDAGTGLGNRRALTADLAAGRRDLLAHPPAGPDPQRTVLLVEVDGVEHVHDVLGPTAADTVLAAVASSLTTLDPRATAYRTGDDEFALVLHGDVTDATALAPTVLDAVRSAPTRVPAARHYALDAVIGVAGTGGARGCGEDTSEDGPGEDLAAAIADADLALRGARTGGTGTVAVFDGAIADAHRRRLLLRERLTAALTAGSLEVHFQPVVDMSTGAVASFEALARWTDDVLGRVSPAEFVAVAEEANLVVALGQHVLTRAVRTAAAAGVFDAGAGLAVNVSVVQLHSPGFTDAVRAVLAECGAPAGLLTLEVTESVFLDTDSPAERVLAEIAALGVRIAIDDFGAGHSSFGYLGRLPAHVLKIDRSLTSTLTEDVDGQSIVSCIVDLATRLGMLVVVEGIETAEQADVCRFLGAQRGQGWLFEAAVPAERLAEQLDRTFATGAALR
ncbi:bifunctional diguanylate cyclase/phosphodiesterase [Kineococcus glutinatus]|uniref:Diguanylate cyclase (GGDEF)-like protein n=1 Tax=Kineococcus glutinatus TaxID=1070872 RepID=A0ABP9HZB4_9ACTN